MVQDRVIRKMADL